MSMSEQTVYCAGGCGKVVLVLRDAKTRNGFVVYCAECDPEKPKLDVPDFMQHLFGGRKF